MYIIIEVVMLYNKNTHVLNCNTVHTGAWVYTINSGNFDALMAVGFYYTLATINFLENVAFSIYKKEDIASFRNLTGVQASGQYVLFKTLFLGILLNSLLGVLTFNSFDFYLMLGKVDGNKTERFHQSKFWKQIVYNINIVVLYLV